MKQSFNKGISNKRAKVNLIAGISFLVIVALALASVGVFFANRKPSPKTEVGTQTQWNTDVWDGSTPSQHKFDEGQSFAKRGEQTYTINSAEAFVAFVNLVNAPEKAKEYNYFKDYTIYLNKNIDLQNRKINSIGVQLEDGSSSFQGVFDGGYYSIINANLSGGLFGYVENATIKNVGLYNASINSTEQYVGGIANYAKNVDIENVYVRLGSISGNSVAGLVGEVAISENGHSIKNSFVSSALNGKNVFGLVANLSNLAETELNFAISNCYYSFNAESANECATINLTQTKVLANPSKSSFSNWEYNSTYGISTWCDYSASDSRFSFTLPILCAFNKVFKNGAFYENVLIDNSTGEATNASTIAEALSSVKENSTAELNIIIPQVVVDQPAELSANATVAINSAVATTLLRGESNTSSLIVSSANSNMVLGSDDSAPITIDGNKTYVQSHNQASGAAVIAMGAKFEMHNVTIKNNINNTDGLGGGLLVYNVNSNTRSNNAANIHGLVTNCSAKNGGGVAVIGSSIVLGTNVTNCSALNNGGGVYVSGKLQEEDSPELASTLSKFNYSKKVSLLDDPIHEDGSSVVLNFKLIENNDAQDGYGGGISLEYCSIDWGSEGQYDDYSRAVRSNYSTADGGGIYVFDCDWDQTSNNLCGMVIEQNRTNYGAGGGIRFYRNSYNSITNAYIQGNQANTYGGGLSIEIVDDDVYDIKLTNLQVGYNATTYYGGGISIFSNRSNYKDIGVTLYGCCCTGNVAAVGGGIYVSNWIESCYIYETDYTDLSPFVYNTMREIFENGSYSVDHGTPATYDYATIFRVAIMQTDEINSEISYNVARYYGGGIYAGFLDTLLIWQTSIDYNKVGDVYLENAYNEIINYGGYTGEWRDDIRDALHTYFYYSPAFESCGGGGVYAMAIRDGFDLTGSTVTSNIVDLSENDHEFLQYKNAYGGGLALFDCGLTNGEISSNSIVKNSDGYYGSFGGGVYIGDPFKRALLAADGLISSDEFGGSLDFTSINSNYADYGGGIMINAPDYGSFGGTLSNNEALYGGAIAYGMATIEEFQTNTDSEVLQSVYGLDSTNIRLSCEVSNNYSAYGAIAIFYDNYDVGLGVSAANELVVDTQNFKLINNKTNGGDCSGLYNGTTNGYKITYSGSYSSSKISGNDKYVTKGFNENDDTFELHYYIMSGGVKTETTKTLTVGIFNDVGMDFADPVLAGYTFKGWATTKTGSPIIASTSDMVNTTYTKDKHTYYAIVEEDIVNVSVTLDANGGKFGSATRKTITETVGQKYTHLVEPTRLGFTFLGWYTSSSDGTLVDSSTTVTRSTSHTLYAHWDENSYTVKFANTGDTTIEDINTTYTEFTFNVDNPSRKGYVFTGWSSNDLSDSALAGGLASGISAWDGSIIKGTSRTYFRYLTTVANKVVTLTANWEAITYKVSFSGNVSIDQKTVAFDEPFYVENPTRDGATFTGWSSNSQYLSDTACVGNSSSSITASWTGSKTTATYFKNLTTVANRVITLTANWDVISYKVSFEGNVSISQKTVKFDAYFNVSNPTRAGYTFMGWTATDLSDTARIGSSSDSITNTWDGSLTKETYFKNLTTTADKTITLTANWKAITYKVSFIGNVSIAQKTVAFDEYFNVDNPTRTGYTFTGWTSSGLSSTARTGTSSDSITTSWTGSKTTATYFKNLTTTADKEITLTAIWAAISYKVSFTGNVSIDQMTVAFDDYFNVANPTRAGYTFSGWTATDLGDTARIGSSSDSITNTWDGSLTKETYFKNLTTIADKEITFTANWAAISYYVAFENTYNETDYPQRTVKFGVAFYIEHPTRSDGYKFTGWTAEGLSSTARYGNGVNSTNYTWKDGQLSSWWYFKNLTTTANKTITLTANWEASTVEVTLNANGGKFGSATTKTITETIGQKYTHLVDPDNREGYTFLGWYTAETSGSVVNAQTSVSNTTAHTLWAHWEAKTYDITVEANNATVSAPQDQSKGTFDKQLTISWAANIPVGYNEGAVSVVIYLGTNTSGTTLATSGKSVNYTMTGTYYSKVKIVVSYAATAKSYTVHDSSASTFGRMTSATSAKYNENLTITYTSLTETGYSFTFVEVKVYSDSALSKQIATSTSATGITYNMSTGGVYYSDIYVVAKYTREAISYNIVYSNNVASIFGGPKTAKYDDVVQIPAPTRTGYTFAGWSSSASAGLDTTNARYGTSEGAVSTTWNGTKVNASFFKNLSSTQGGTVTLTANWDAIQYTISFAGDDVSLDNKTASYDTAVEIANPTRDGYNFDGWTSSSQDGLMDGALSGTSAQTATSAWNGAKNKNTFFKNLRSQTGTVTLTAVWSIKQYKLNYSASKGRFIVPAVSGQSFDYNANVTLNYANDNKTGYEYGDAVIRVYSGDSANADKYLTTLTNSSSFNLKSVVGKYYDNIFMALSYEETAIQYTIAFSGIGTSGLSSQTATYDTAINIANPPERTGFEFTGWTASSNLSTTTAMYGDSLTSTPNAWSDYNQKVTSTYFLNLLTSADTITLTANWQEKSYNIYTGGVYGSITSPETGSTAKYNQTITITFAPDGEAGYRYTLLSVEVFYAKTESGKGLTINEQDGSYTFTMTDSTGWHDDIYIKVSYARDGLSYNVSYKTDNARINVNDTGVFDQDLEISWEPEQETGFKFSNLIVNVYGGTEAVGDPIATYNTGSQATFNMLSLNKGYFENIYITVSYTKTVIEYSIVYKDSDNVVDATEFSGPVKAEFNQEIVINHPTKTGYTFLGWTADGTMGSALTSADGSDWLYWSGLENCQDTNFKNLRSEEGTVTLTANWQANSYSVVLNYGYETPTTTKPAVYYTDVVIDNPVREGYTFKGWSTSQQAGLNPETAKTSVSSTDWQDWDGALTTNTHFMNLTAQQSGTVTLTAEWQVLKYNILTGGNNGTVTAPSSSDYDKAISISWQPQTERGYKFTLDYIYIYNDPTSSGVPSGEPIFTSLSADNNTFNMSSDLGKFYENILIYVSYTKKAINYTIDIVVNYSTGKSKTQTLTADFDEPIRIENPNIDGYEFVGWTSGTEFGLEETAQVSPTGTGGWTPWDGSSSLNEFFMNLRTSENDKVILSTTLITKQYTISYQATNGKFNSPEDGSKHDYDANVTIAFENNNKTGYSYSENATIRVYAGKEASAEKIITTYNSEAQFEFNLSSFEEETKQKLGNSYFEDVLFVLSYEENPISYLIDYDLDRGTASADNPKSAEFDQSVTILLPTKEGYDCIGWKGENLNLETAQISEDGDVWQSWDGNTTKFTFFKNLSSTEGNTVTLKAMYQAKQYDIAFAETNEFVNILTPSEHDHGYFDSPLSISWETENLEGYAYTFKSFTVFGVEQSNNTPLLTYTSQMDVHSPISFNMSEIENGKYYQSILIEIKYDRNFAPCTLTVNANGGTINATQGWQVSVDSKTATKNISYNDQFGELPTATRDGYVFDGWYDNLLDGSPVDKETIITGDTTIYAYWKRDINALEITYEKSHVYTGSEIQPEVTILDGEDKLDVNQDYLISYSNNTDVTETGTITITPQNNYAGEVVIRYFAITPKSIDSLDISVEKIADVQFDDNHTPEIVVKDNGRPSDGLGYTILLIDVEYSTEYDNYTNATENASVTILGTGNYNGSRKETYKILPRSLEGAEVELTPSSFMYNGQNQVPKIVVKKGEIVIPESDYDITFKLAEEEIEQDQIKNIGSYTVVITGKNNADGELETSFEIASLSLDSAVVSLDKTEFIYNRTAQNPTVKSVTIGEYNLTEYSVKYYNSVDGEKTTENETPTDAGSYVLVIESTNKNVISTYEQTFEILPAKLAGASVSLQEEESEYNGQPKDIVVTSVVTTEENNSLELVKNSEYTISYSRLQGSAEDKTNVGTIIITISANSSNFEGSTTKQYKITPALINNVQHAQVESVVYNRNEHQPEVNLTYNEIPLVKDVDYTLSWEDNIDAGEGKIIITAKTDFDVENNRYGNFKNGEERFVVSFTIKPATIDNDGLTLNPNSATYNRKPQAITIGSLTASEKTLTLKAEEYSIKYYRNYGLLEQTEISQEQDFINVGIITVEIFASSKNFVVADGAHITAEFEIVPAELTLISLSGEKLTYNRKPQQPSEIKVYAGSLLLTQTEEYTIKFYRDGVSSNDITNAGDIIVRVELISSNFVDKTNVENSYTIERKNIQELRDLTEYYEGNWKVEQGKTVFDFDDKKLLAEPQVYVGQQVFPIITFDDIPLVYNFIELTENNEYSYAIYSNKDSLRENPLLIFEDVGSYDLVITGLGNYDGTITKTYQVKPAELNDDNVRIVLTKEAEKFYYNGEPYVISPDDIEVYWTDKDDHNKEYKLGYTPNDVELENQNLEEKAKVGWTFYNGEYEYRGEGNELINTVTVNSGFVNNENAGTATMFIKGLNNFFGVVTKSFKIEKAQLTKQNLTITLDNTDFTYDSFDKTPKPKVMWNNKPDSSIELVENVNYVVEYENNVNAGINTAKVYIRNVDETEDHANNNNVTFVEEIFETFTIKQYNINSGRSKIYVNGENETYASTVVYDKNRQLPPELSISFKPNEQTTRHLEQGTDYELSYFRMVDGSLQETDDFTSVGEITIKITGENNFTDTLEYTYTISTKEIDKLELATEFTTYNDASQFDNIVLSVFSTAEKVDAAEYVVEYYRDDVRIEAQTGDFKNAGEITIKVTSANKNYTVKGGELSIVFTIKKLNLNDANLTVDIHTYEYTGEQIRPETPKDFVVVYNDRNLTAEEFEISNYGKNLDKTTSPENAKTAYVVLTGKGNFEGSYYAYFEIVGIDLGGEGNADKLKIDGVKKAEYVEKEFVFDNFEHKYKPTITYTNELGEDVKLEEFVDVNYKFYRYTDGQVDDVETSDFTNVGKIHLTILGMENYGGKLELDYVISQKSFADNVEFNISFTNSYTYTGNPIELVVNSITISYGSLVSYKLTSNDYDATIYTNNLGNLGDLQEQGAINAGKYFYVITGKNNFKDSYKFEFEISKKQLDESSFSVEIEQKTYNGQDATPDITVSYNGKELQAGEDYDITIEPQPVLNAGEYKVEIKAKGNNFEGSITKTFTIEQLDINLAHGFETLFSGTSENYTYTYSGENVLDLIKNALVYTLNEIEVPLVDGQDYFVTTLDQGFTNVNSYSVSFNGKGNYKNILTIKFNIIAKTLTEDNLNDGLEIVVPQDLEFTGEKLNPDIHVSLNGETLTEGEDYTVEFVPSEVLGAGSYDVHVKFKGNLSGELTQKDALVVKKRKLNFDIKVKDDAHFYAGDLKESVLENLIIPEDALQYGDFSILDADSQLETGEQQVTWKFTPKAEYLDNYDEVTGNVNVNVEAVEIDNLTIALTSENAKLEYFAYDKFIPTDVELTITVNYNNGSTKILNSLAEEGLSYKFNIELSNDLLTVDVNKLTVSFTENEKVISADVVVAVSPINIGLKFVNDQAENSLVEGADVASKFEPFAVESKFTDKLQYLKYSISFENAEGQTSNLIGGYNYIAKLNVNDNNFVVAGNGKEFYLKPTKLTSSDFNSAYAYSAVGFEKGTELVVRVITNANEIEEKIGTANKPSNIEYLIVFEFEKDGQPYAQTNYTIYFKLSEFSKFRAYILNADNLIDITNTADRDGYVQFGSGMIALTNVVQASTTDIRWLVFFVILLILLLIFIIFLIERLITKRKRKKMVDELNENVKAKA